MKVMKKKGKHMKKYAADVYFNIWQLSLRLGDLVYKFKKM